VLKSAGKEIEFHTYSGTAHWFFENDRPEYDAAADLAWQRNLHFLEQQLI
jgi:carboxymethylenebutenolidase